VQWPAEWHDTKTAGAAEPAAAAGPPPDTPAVSALAAMAVTAASLMIFMECRTLTLRRLLLRPLCTVDLPLARVAKTLAGGAETPLK
jgi:hypothetical protein